MIDKTIGWNKIDVVAGGETAGIPFAAFLAALAKKPMIYVRKQPKGFGRMAQIEGDLKPGKRVLLVEDLATDGGSKLVFIEALKKAEAKVTDCFVIFHYGIFPQSIEMLAAGGVKLHALATWWDALEAAREAQVLRREGPHRDARLPRGAREMVGQPRRPSAGAARDAGPLAGSLLRCGGHDPPPPLAPSSRSGALASASPAAIGARPRTSSCSP